VVIGVLSGPATGSGPTLAPPGLAPHPTRRVKPGRSPRPHTEGRTDPVARIRGLNRQTTELKRELLELVKAHRPQLLAETGCGPLTAAILIGRTAGAERFRSDASFALQSGTAPIPCSSGQRQQHRLNRGGDRQLNHALHIIAITRAGHDPATKAYLERKEAEGKTTKGALRCLKRHLADASTSSCPDLPKPPSQIPAPRRKSQPIPAGATAAASTRASPAPPQPRCPA
jgi:transposase